LEEASRVAESYYAQARKAVREGDYHGAIQYGKLAVSYNPQDARYYFMLADCQARNPESRWQRQAEQNYAKATELDPWNVDYWMSLGRFYKRRGMTIRARKQFEAALKLSPSHREAVEELESMS
jgi:Flp pilus assembly protein TadD